MTIVLLCWLSGWPFPSFPLHLCFFTNQTNSSFLSSFSVPNSPFLAAHTTIWTRWANVKTMANVSSIRRTERPARVVVSKSVSWLECPKVVSRHFVCFLSTEWHRTMSPSVWCSCSALFGHRPRAVQLALEQWTDKCRTIVRHVIDWCNWLSHLICCCCLCCSSVQLSAIIQLIDTVCRHSLAPASRYRRMCTRCVRRIGR